MKKRNWKKIVMAITVVLVTVVLGTAAMIIRDIFGRDKSNFFAYAIDLENENWAYAPKGLDYGMTVEDVIKAERLKNYIWEKSDEILRTEQSVKNPFGKIEEFDFVKRYFFDSKGGLASVRYELAMDEEYDELIRQMLYEQALAYLPETNRKTEMEDIAVLGEWMGEVLQEYGEEEDRCYENWLPVTRVVWEDTVYSEADETVPITHANSDVIFSIDVQINSQIKLSLCVSRYENRLTEAEIQKLREAYPISNEIHPMAGVVMMPFEVRNREVEGNFTCVEVTDDYTTYYEKSSDKFYEYPVKVILDSNGNQCHGVQGYLYSSMNMKPYDPQVHKGMKVLMPGCTNLESAEHRWRIDWNGMFYVTDSGHVLTVFDENIYSYFFERYAISESTLCGLTLEDFFRKVKW